jgi:hypothetical protein
MGKLLDLVTSTIRNAQGSSKFRTLTNEPMEPIVINPGVQLRSESFNKPAPPIGNSPPNAFSAAPVDLNSKGNPVSIVNFKKRQNGVMDTGRTAPSTAQESTVTTVPYNLHVLMTAGDQGNVSLTRLKIPVSVPTVLENDKDGHPSHDAVWHALMGSKEFHEARHRGYKLHKLIGSFGEESPKTDEAEWDLKNDEHEFSQIF